MFAGLADRCVKEAVQHSLQEYKADGKDFAVLALGGFGRASYFRIRSGLAVSLQDKRIEQQLQAVVAQASRALWDLGFKVSAAARTMDECKRVDHENVEFHLAMLDRRLLAGDRPVFQQLEDRLLPRLEKAVASISAWGIAKADRATFGKIWQHHFSSGAQREGSARRIAGLPRECLDTLPGMRSERADWPGSRRTSNRTKSREFVSEVPMFSALRKRQE